MAQYKIVSKLIISNTHQRPIQHDKIHFKVVYIFDLSCELLVSPTLALGLVSYLKQHNLKFTNHGERLGLFLAGLMGLDQQQVADVSRKLMSHAQWAFFGNNRQGFRFQTKTDLYPRVSISQLPSVFDGVVRLPIKIDISDQIIQLDPDLAANTSDYLKNLNLSTLSTEYILSCVILNMTNQRHIPTFINQFQSYAQLLNWQR